MNDDNPIIPLDTTVNYNDEDWKVSCVMSMGGERYYGLTLGDGNVALVPASILEKEKPQI